jgi:peptidylprolyl isomerase
VNYVGVDYRTGAVFNSTWSTNQPATFPLSETIPGFGEGIAGMRVGGRREIVIPPALAYGAAGRPPVIGKNETLVFVVDLLDVQG